MFVCPALQTGLLVLLICICIGQAPDYSVHLVTTIVLEIVCAYANNGRQAHVLVRTSVGRGVPVPQRRLVYLNPRW